ncbi:hypothetical protein BCO9919_07525 [Burkholderia cenocepacia]|uniref:Uncharacterized protein n=1 Tax=Burkholderia cenocepacia TaxID=95486 RepID=A0A6J5JX42_9BURK|nr:hypothetical protein BCO9919_07525 [Burkholderia cenocepacia]
MSANVFEKHQQPLRECKLREFIAEIFTHSSRIANLVDGQRLKIVDLFGAVHATTIRPLHQSRNDW